MAAAWTNDVSADAMTKESLLHAVEATFERLALQNERARTALCLRIEQYFVNSQLHPLASPSIPFGPTGQQSAEPAGAQPGAMDLTPVVALGFHSLRNQHHPEPPGKVQISGSTSRQEPIQPQSSEPSRRRGARCSLTDSGRSVITDSRSNVPLSLPKPAYVRGRVARTRCFKPVRKSALPTRAPVFAEIEEVPMPLRQPGSAPKKRAWPRMDGARVAHVRPQAESKDSALVPPSEGVPPASSASRFFPLANLLSPAPPSNSTIMMLPDVLTILQTKPQWLESVAKMRVPSMIEALNLEPCAAKKKRT